MYKVPKIKEIIKNNENNRLIVNNVIGSFLIKGGALFVSFFTLPAYMEYFEDQQILGLWFTILSVLTWILTFDLGIGNGLRNHLVYALASKDVRLAKKYISSAYIVIGILVLLVLILSLTLYKYINWNEIFNIPVDIVSSNILNITVFIIFFGIMLQLFFKLISSILYAMQKSALTNMLNLLTNIIILIYVSLTPSSNVESDLIQLAVVYVLAVNIPLLSTTIIVFSTKLKDSRPSIKYFRKKYASDVMKLGGIFFWVQIMYMILTTTNEFLITWLIGPEKVVEYQIYNRLFTLIGTLFTLALIPIWSIVTKAISENNYKWIKKLYKTLQLLALFGIICEFFMILFLQIVINLWLGENAIQVNYLYATIFALSGSIFIWNGVLSSIANGFGELKIQSIYFTIGAIIKIPIAWFLVMLFDSWISIIVANIIAMSLYCIIQPLWLKRFLNKKEIGAESYV